MRSKRFLKLILKCLLCYETNHYDQAERNEGVKQNNMDTIQEKLIAFNMYQHTFKNLFAYLGYATRSDWHPTLRVSEFVK